MNSIFRHIRAGLLAVFFPVLFIAVSCQQKEDVEFSVYIKYADVDGGRGTQWVQVSALSGQEWTLSIADQNGAAVNWATLDPPYGSGTKNSVTVTWEQNDTGAARTLVITGVCNGETVSVTLNQQPSASGGSSGGGGSTLPDTIVPDKVYGWMELPATNNDNLYFITHASSTANGAGRNFSYYWDVDALVAHWVAYPLNKGCIASGSRTNQWGLDPKLPRSAQPVLYSGYRSSSTDGNSDGGTAYWQRGHQCPSADRLAYSDNVQTFYGTNMTPQDGDLNENIWAALETYVRDRSKEFDTLYVVTGCVITGSDQHAYDNDGKKVTVPVAYYKALLGYDKNQARGISSQTRGYTGVGFYFEHRGYSSNDYMQCAMTIDQLETKVGEDFYVNLENAIGRDMYLKVESTKDNYWWGGY